MSNAIKPTATVEGLAKLAVNDPLLTVPKSVRPLVYQFWAMTSGLKGNETLLPVCSMVACWVNLHGIPEGVIAAALTELTRPAFLSHVKFSSDILAHFAEQVDKHDRKRKADPVPRVPGGVA